MSGDYNSESRHYNPRNETLKYKRISSNKNIEIRKNGEVSQERIKELARRERIERHHKQRVRRKQYFKTRITMGFIVVGVLALMSGYTIRKVQVNADNKIADRSLLVDGQVQGQLLDGEQQVNTQVAIYQDWKLALVNYKNPIQITSEVELTTLSNGLEVDSRIVEPLQNLIKAGLEEAGLDIIVCSAYRSKEYQTDLFNERVHVQVESGKSYLQAYEHVCEQTALPGTSEHELGLAVDLVGRDYQNLDAKQAKTATAIWLEQNCDRFGFILRYPEGKEEITGINYESWHFRYVGESAAKIIMDEEITLEEYLNIK